MFEAMRLAATLSLVQTSDPALWVTTRETQKMSFVVSASLLGVARVGRIAPGWAADLLFLDAGCCHYTPLRNPLDQIVLAENGTALREVMIDGRYVFADDRILTLDEPKLATRAHEAVARLDAASAETRRMNEAASLVVQSYCRGQCEADPTRYQMKD